MQNDVLDQVVERSLARRRAASTNEVRRLMEAGIAVMRRTGSIDPKVSDIVGHAGLSNQAFYRHFEGKDELLLAIMAEGRRELLSFLERKMAGASDAKRRIRQWVEGVLAQARNPEAAEATRPFAVNAPRLAHQFPEEAAASADALKAPLVAALSAAGSSDPQRDADALYLLAFGAMERHLVAGTKPSDAEVAHLVEFALRAVA